MVSLSLGYVFWFAIPIVIKGGLSEATAFLNTAKIYELNLMSLQISQEWLAYHLATFFGSQFQLSLKVAK